MSEQITYRRICQKCGGDGNTYAYDDPANYPCEHCDGTGKAGILIVERPWPLRKERD